jgi:photosystem II stability/assembly factor-like uncharacterized protein
MAAKKKTGERSGKQKGRYPLLVVGLVVLGIGAIAVYSIASQQGSDKVERFMHLHGLAVPAWAPDEVYVASHQGLARIDAEGHWRFVSNTAHDFMGFQANHTEEGVLYSSGHPAPGSNFPNPVGFMRSRDEGKTWSLVSLAGQVDFHVMAVQPTNGDVIYGYSGGLMRSLDGGKNWEKIVGGIGRIGNVYALAIDPASPDTLLVGSNSGLWRSRDAGKTWENLIPEVPVTAVVHADDRLLAYAVSPEAGLVSSGDNGENWRPSGFFLDGDDAIAYIAPRPEDAQVLFVGSFGQDIYKTTDGGGSWERLARGGVPEEHGDDHD